MSRFVIIDDTNPSIQYSGPWFEATNNTLPQTVGVGGSYNGLPFQNTLHGVNVDAQFSFNFSGSAVSVYGTSIVTINDAGIQDPTWECFIDNASIGSSPAADSGVVGNQNNWILCGIGHSQIRDGPHLLTVKANVANQQTFWFDQIEYVPSANVSLDQSLLRIDSSDSVIQYSPGWQFEDFFFDYASTPFGNLNASIADTNGANLAYEFSGTSISMFGDKIISRPISNLTYTIDDQEPISFIVGNTSGISLYNQMYFESGQLSPGQHKLVVTFLGNNNTQPLFLNYFVVQVQQDAPSSTSSITPSTGVSVPPGKPNTDAIVGGVIGGLVLISLLIALFFFLRRHNNRR